MRPEYANYMCKRSILGDGLFFLFLNMDVGGFLDGYKALSCMKKKKRVADEGKYTFLKIPPVITAGASYLRSLRIVI